MADTGGINITVTMDTASAVAQRLICWDREGGVRMQAVQYRTDGNLPYFRVPAGACADRDALTLTPGGTTIACPTSGNPTQIQPTLAELGGLNPNTCTELPVPSGLAVVGSPTQSSITVDWDAPASGTLPTGYRVAYRQDGSTGAWSYREVGAVTQATISGLTAGTAYDFRVQARVGTYLSPPTADTTISTAS